MKPLRKDRCLDADTALSLGQLLGPDPSAALEHIVICRDCRARLEQWDQVGQALSDAPPRAGFTDEVLDALPKASRRPAPGWGWRALNAGLSFAAAGLLLLLLGAAGSPAALLAGSLVAALIGLAAREPGAARSG